MNRMIISLTFAVSLVVPALTSAQNTFPTNGPVGIGTLTPRAMLDVVGNNVHVYTSDGSSDGWSKDGLTVFSNPGVGHAALRITSAHFPGPDRYLMSVDLAGQSRFAIATDGNVGVGTPTPQAKLHVVGTTLFDFSATGGGRLSIGSNPNDNRVFIQAASSGGTEPAEELVLAGYTTQSLPKFRVVANESTFSGKILTSTLELTSDRNQKQDFRSVSVADVLAKVAALPIANYAYTNSPSVRHIGPMAQDFKAAFNLGEDDKHIGAGDGIGVALAAIKGLHDLVHEKDAEIAAVKRKNAQLEQQMMTLSKQVSSIQDTVANLAKSISKSGVQQASFRQEANR